MSFSDWITLAGVVVTLISMSVTIHQARSAFRSSQVANNAITAVKLAAVAERLKSAQEHIRDLAPDKPSQRGVNIGKRAELIRREFDIVLSALPKNGMGSEARTQLAAAQVKLNIYQKSLQSTPDSEAWQELQRLVQDAISDIVSATSSLGVQK